jgi:predicted phage terminase large subunit-like protein
MHGNRGRETWADVEQRLRYYRQLQIAEARHSFFAFRNFVRPDMMWGWWVQELTLFLDQFFKDFFAGKRPKAVLMAPPQHGKSLAIEDLIAYAMGRCPWAKVIFSSFSDDLGVDRNNNLQRLMTTDEYRLLFPTIVLGGPGTKYKANDSLIELVGKRGSFINTTVNGQINGKALDLGVIDDPVKGRLEANSKTMRDRTWNWFADDFLSRMSKDSAMLIIMTRWHVDDLLGRYMAKNPDIKVFSYPAIAIKDEKFRRKGEALFDQFKPLSFLLERKSNLSQGSWESLYQQTPIIIGGGMFPIEKLQVLPVFDRSQIASSVRYVDKAGTKDGDGAETAMVLMHKMKNGIFVIENVTAGRWGALQREEKLKALANADRMALPYHVPYEIVVEQEPGSGGKESAEATIRNLSGFSVFADRPTGDKETRADPFSAQVQGGNVWLVAGNWISEYLEQLEAFPNGKLKDKVDASSGAFARLTCGPIYDTSMSWGQ